MQKKLVYICSPLRGNIKRNIAHAREYCELTMQHYPDVIPIAPHIYFTQFLDDTIPAERSKGMEAGLVLLEKCDEVWVFGINYPSEGMEREIEYAKAHGIPVRDGYLALAGEAV